MAYKEYMDDSSEGSADEEKKLSKYNSGLDVIKRLDRLWTDAVEFIKEDKYYQWNNMLDRIWLELCILMTDSEFEKFKVTFEEYNIKLNDSGKIIDDIDAVKGFQVPNKGDFLKRNSQYNLIKDKDEYLRRIQHKVETHIEVKGKNKGEWD